MHSLSLHLLPPVPPDPIFALAAEAKAAGTEAIDGTIGMILDDDGQPAMLPSVGKALADRSAILAEKRYGYTPLLGLPAYRACVTDLIFGGGALSASVATTGGTGAIAIGLRLAKRLSENIRVLTTSPAYANHRPLCREAGLDLLEVPHLLQGKPTIEGLIDALRFAKGPRLLLLQAGCHNPTGLDWTREQWKELVIELQKHDCLVLLDFPYQGFAGEPDDDAYPARLLAASGVPLVVAWSGAKNHSLYRERPGLCAAVVPDDSVRMTVEGHLSSLTRSIHSAAATFAQEIVTTVQTLYKDEWLHELGLARELLRRKRQTLHANLPEELRFSVSGQGMFALLPLGPGERERLQKNHLVFLTGDGRLNIAGIPLSRMPELGEKIRMARGEA